MGIFDSNTPVTQAIYDAAIANAKRCAIKKGCALIESFEEACCEEDQATIELMMNLIDAIECIVPEGLVIGGDQANLNQPAGGGNIWPIQQFGGTATVDLTVGASVYPQMSIPSAVDEETLALAIVDIINAYYPQNFPYTAEYLFVTPFHCVNIIGSDYDESNGTTVTTLVTAGSGSNGTNTALDGGTEVVYQGENAITNNDLQVILTKLCQLCKN